MKNEGCANDTSSLFVCTKAVNYRPSFFLTSAVTSVDSVVLI